MSQKPSRLTGLLLHSGPDPLRNTVMGIFLLILLACLIMIATSLVGLGRMQQISNETQDGVQALLALEKLRRGEREVQLSDLSGRDALERALIGGNQETLALALDRYEQAALQSILEAEEKRAQQLRIQLIAGGVLMFGTLVGLVGLLYWLFGVLLKPIEDLAGLARRVREGELSWRASPFTQPELNELGQALNDMLEVLELRLQELDRQRSDWEALVGSIPDAWLSLDADQKVTLANPAARDLAGEDWTGRQFEELPLVRQDEQRWLLTRSDGTQIPLRSKRVELASQRSLLHLRDLQLEERLERLRQEAVSVVLHELRGPSRRLVELCESYGNAELASQARYLRGLVHNLSLTEALSQGRWSTRMVDVELDALLDEVAQSLSGLAREREIELEVKGEECRLAGDPEQLGLLCSTLLRRLIEESPPGSKLRLAVRLHQEQVWLELTPQEASLASQVRHWINGNATESDGAGLLRQILKSHEAYLENEPGERLRIVLPVREARPVPSVTEVEPDQSAPQRPALRVGCWVREPALAAWLRRSLRRDFELCEPGEGLELHVIDLDDLPEQIPAGRLVALATRPAEQIEKFVELEAVALLDKDSSAGELRSALLRVQGGATVLSSEAAQGLRLHASKARRQAPSAFLELTGREQEIFRSITQGLSNKEIAEALVISEGTVKTHVNNLLRKLHLKDRVQLLLYAAQHDLLVQ
ncbi:MAG: hypothetical protein AMXMBFR33_53920 [Candidatus Xenobia bacterium]